MAKRKKSKQQPKSKQVADSETEQPATATQDVADVAKVAADTEPAPELAGEPISKPIPMPKRKKGKQHAKGQQVANSETEQPAPATQDVADVAQGAAETERAMENEAEPSETEQAADASSADAEPVSPAESSAETAAEAQEQTSDEETRTEVQTETGNDVTVGDAPADASAAQESVPAAAQPETGTTAEGETSAEPTGDAEAEGQATLDETRLESIIESLLFASDKALGLSDLKRLLGERDGKKIGAAVQALIQKRHDSGIQVVALSTGWHLRTAVDNAAWVSKLMVGKPVRLSRAMMETLAIVAYRQPVTRPEIDDIRGVDCGPVLKTLLDRGLVRIIGKREEVGRPMLYGTTPEFLRVFNLRELSELPTLREFCDLSAEDQSKVEAEHGEAPATPSAITAKPDVALTQVARGELAAEPEDTDPLLDELDEASKVAKQVLGDLEPSAEEEKTDEKPDEPRNAASDETETKNEPESTPAGE